MRLHIHQVRSLLTRNGRVLHVASPLIAILTILAAFAVPAQEPGAGQRSAKLSVAAAAGVDSAERVAESLLQRTRHDAHVTTPDNPVSFLPPVAYDSGGYTASFVAVGDVNGDGKLDIVMGNECASSGCVRG